jgi:hypothetical protein
LRENDNDQSLLLIDRPDVTGRYPEYPFAKGFVGIASLDDSLAKVWNSPYARSVRTETKRRI